MNFTGSDAIIAERRRQLRDEADQYKRFAEPVARIDHKILPENLLGVPTRIYTPKGDAPHPVILHIHGGGWIMGDLDTHDNICRYLCRHVEAIVVAVDYGLSPENKFPSALTEVFRVAYWLSGHAHELDGDESRLAVLGDSSGGNLAVALCLKARASMHPTFLRQILINPTLNLASFDTASYRNNEDTGFSTHEMAFFRDCYLETDEQRLDPLASPLLADDFRNLPPAFVVTSELDILRDDGEQYLGRLDEANVPTECYRMEGRNHGGMRWAVAGEDFRDSLEAVVSELRIAFRSVHRA